MYLAYERFTDAFVRVHDTCVCTCSVSAGEERSIYSLRLRRSEPQQTDRRHRTKQTAADKVQIKPPTSETSFNSWGSTYSTGSSLMMSWAPCEENKRNVSQFPRIPQQIPECQDAFALPWRRCPCRWSRRSQDRWTWASTPWKSHTHNPSLPGWPGWHSCSCEPCRCAGDRKWWTNMKRIQI